MPNQYFIHKNHLVVLKALTRVIKQNRNTGMTIISTGLNNDHRHPNYFNSITKFIKLNGLKNNYKYLGIVPYLDMMSLIYHSIASKFYIKIYITHSEAHFIISDNGIGIFKNIQSGF